MCEFLSTAFRAGRRRVTQLSKLYTSIVTNSWLELAARWILGLTFIYASFHKIISPAEFAEIVYGYDLFPQISINLIAIIVPYLELITGIALVAGIYPRSAAVIINGLLLGYLAALSINFIRGHEFDCGCFSAGQNGHSSSSEVMLIRDAIYFILGLLIILFSGIRRFSLFRRRP